MNILRFEIKTQFKGFLVWAFSLTFMLLLFVTAFYSAFIGSKEAVRKALENLPPAFALVFGLSLNTIFTFGGFFQFIYMYIGLVGAIMAVSLALNAFAREKRAKCADFLLAKPVQRSSIFVYKLLSCLAFVILTNVLFVGCAVIAYTANGEPNSGIGRLITAASSLFFMQLVFLSIGILYAVFAKKVRSVSGSATAFGFAGFILMALQSLLKEDIVRFISPFTYFQPGAVFLTGAFETKYVITAIAVVAICISLSYQRYCFHDAHAI